MICANIVVKLELGFVWHLNAIMCKDCGHWFVCNMDNFWLRDSFIKIIIKLGSSACLRAGGTPPAHKDSRLLRRAKDELRHVTCAVSTVECVLFWIEFCVSESFPNVENRCRRGVSTCRKFYKKVADKGYNAILFRRLLFWPSGRGTERCAWWRGWRCPGA